MSTIFTAFATLNFWVESSFSVRVTSFGVEIQKVVKGEDISADFTDTKSETAGEQPSTDEMNA